MIDEPQGVDVATIPFRLWPDQLRLMWALLGRHLVIILKARQLGISWLVCAYGLWICLTQPGRLVLLFSRGQLEADELARRIGIMYQRLPEWLKSVLPGLVTDNKSELAWSNGSRVQSLPATENAGRSFTASLVICDEFAFMSWAEKLYTAVKPTIDAGGQLIVLSTANGENNQFAKLWADAIARINGFLTIFLPWWSRPDRTPAWRARQDAEYPFTWQAFQEYPATPKEAFQSTGNEHFLPDILLWDQCQEDLPPITPRLPIVLSADAGVNNDSFGLVGVSRHPARNADVAMQLAYEWTPSRLTGFIDFGAPEGPEQTVRKLCARGSGYNIVQLCYDPFQLHDMATRLQREGVVMTRPFSQGSDRLEADKQLLDLTVQRRLAHRGQANLRAHIQNADKKPDANKLRLVKREASLKIDLAVAASMGTYRCLKLPL